MTSEPRLVWEGEAPSADAPVWLADARMLLLCDPTTGRILSFDPASGAMSAMAVGGRPSFVWPTHDGRLLYGSERELRLIAPDGSTSREQFVDTLASNCTDSATVDSLGRLWFGVSDCAGESPGGNLMRYHDERVVPMLFDLVHARAPALTPDSRTLYALNPVHGLVERYTVNRAGALSEREMFVSFHLLQGQPCAVALDAGLCLWLLLRGGSKVQRYCPHGELLQEVVLPESYANGLAFGGADLRTLYITGADALWALDLDVAGLPVTPFRLASGSHLGLVDDDDH